MAEIPSEDGACVGTCVWAHVYGHVCVHGSSPALMRPAGFLAAAALARRQTHNHGKLPSTELELRLPLPQPGSQSCMPRRAGRRLSWELGLLGRTGVGTGRRGRGEEDSFCVCREPMSVRHEAGLFQAHCI